MWVILAKKGLDVYRDDLISSILEEEKTQPEQFIASNKSWKYSTTPAISMAKMYMREESCKRFIKKFTLTDKTQYNSPYSWIKDYHLSFRRVTIEEWGVLCDRDLYLLNSKYEHNKSKIEKKRKSYK